MAIPYNPAESSETSAPATARRAGGCGPGERNRERARIAVPVPTRYRVLVALVLGGIASLAGAADVRRDVVYGQAGGEQLLLDASVPDGAGPFPVAILIHGGGWNSGDKSGSDRPGNGADITPWFAPLTAAKFVWFSINYRHAPQHRWPACFEDVQTAVRWAKAHAAEHKGDPERIALVGHSAGGHLALMLATQSRADTRVQAVVGFAPVSDHEQDLAQRGGLSTALQQLLDLPKEVTPASLQALRAISPVNRVRGGMPPMLILHGEADKTVPLAQSQAWQRRMRSAGNRCELIVLKGAPHTLLPWEKSDPTWPEQMTTWLRATLGAAPAGVRK